jgi:uncharacterized membrane protein YphA (DoxX/SURF4 family)
LQKKGNLKQFQKKMALQDIVRIMLKVAVTFMFFLAGINKVHPSFHPDTYIQLDQAFRNGFAPLWQKLLFDTFDYDMSPTFFKSAIGFTELIICVMLWIGNTTSLFGSLVGLAIMIAAVFTHLQLQEPYSVPAVLAVIFILILLLSPTKKVAKKNA